MAKGETYEEFVDKFVPKLTTDDCYTPQEVYDTIADWVTERYGVARCKMLRPFWPGGDYQAEEYEDGAVVVDNPPFSIMRKVVLWYLDRGVKFFLFAPAMTLFGAGRDCCSIVTASTIVYENGAEVPTEFVTNLDGRRILVEPELGRRIAEAVECTKLAKGKKVVRKMAWPDEVVNAALLRKIAAHGVQWEAWPEDCEFVRKLDGMKGGIFGGGFLLGARAAAERAAAERAAAERFELSQRERAIVEKLGGNKHG